MVVSGREELEAIVWSSWQLSWRLDLQRKFELQILKRVGSRSLETLASIR